MSFKEELAAAAGQVNDMLEKWLPQETGHQRTLLEAMNYSMRAGGKRIRPLLMQSAYRMYGGSGQVVEPFMAAMEMIHTHSLIHDDLPAMDNDEYRRGKKTTHVVYGEAMAILAGDALLNLAYETALSAFRVPGADPACVAEALGVLARKTGISGMIGGQSVDVQLEGQPLEEDQLAFIYNLKTGALIEASLMTGALLAGAGPDEAARMERIGHRIGLAFQIRDDILDVTGTDQVLGKPTGSDERNHKTTYVTLHTLEEAGREVRALTDDAIAELDGIEGEHDFLRSLLLYLAGREN